ncbi:MAG: cytochrome ubiquinol oxidase subunit I, partial [Verrucomicrobiae bacterium]|nr:cytochrome ubiquinol oxidase subunit I [Verrucomicrobiae bacterium]
FATWMVCLGAHFSAVWIAVANSWQQTPAGYRIAQTANGPRAVITDFWQMVFNPSSLDRLSHTLCGAWQAGAFLVISVSAFYLLRRRHETFAKASMKVGLGVALVASVLQIVTGHSSAVGVAENQPAKLAAFEGRYTTRDHAPLSLAGWIDEQQEDFAFNVEVPGMLSWLVHGNTAGVVRGLEEFKPEDRPPVNASFQFFHLMVAVGFGLLGLAGLGSWFCWRGTLFQHRWLLWLLVFAVLGPQLANQAGWFAAEVGRQPWIVYGELRTSDGLSAVVTSKLVLTSLVLFTVVYVLLFAVFAYLLNDKIHHGPDETDLIPSGALADHRRADA